MMKFFRKNNLIILSTLIVLILIAIIIVLKSFLYPEDLGSIYGSRLNDIEKNTISKTQLNEIKEKAKKTKQVKEIDIDIKGKIINVMLEVEEKSEIEQIKKAMESILETFETGIIEYYDFQFFLTNENLEFVIIGYKNKTNEKIVYTEYTKVSEEDSNEEE